MDEYGDPLDWRHSIRSESIACMVCRKEFGQITARHLVHHDMDMSQYRERFGIPPSQPLSARKITERRGELIRKANPWLKAPSGPKIDPIIRFTAKVAVDINTSCHLWTGTIDLNGYGKFPFGGKPVLAHRWIYELAHGKVADGLEIDHLCRVRHCVNPEHLEAVTHGENVRRGGRGAFRHYKESVAKRKSEYSDGAVYDSISHEDWVFLANLQGLPTVSF